MQLYCCSACAGKRGCKMSRSVALLFVAFVAILANHPADALLNLFSWLNPPRAPAPVPVTNFVTGTPKPWNYMTATSGYDPARIDWAGLRSACRAVVQFEKRLGNFWIRVSFHDALSVNVAACLVNSANCGGADGSLLLNMTEMLRPENNYDGFSRKAARVSYRIAAHYGTSMADTIAVCAACAVEVLSKDRVKFFGTGNARLRVGRLDSSTASPPGTLPAADIPVSGFLKFFYDRGFTAEEAAALLGSHSLIDDQGCITNDWLGKCTPAFSGTCQDVRMFRWENHYFKDACTPRIEVRARTPADADPPVPSLGVLQFSEYQNTELCKFTSDLYRGKARNEVALARSGAVTETDPVPNQSVDWYVGSSSVKRKWFYTVNDAFLGRLCQNSSTSLTLQETQLKQAYLRFSHPLSGHDAWDPVYVSAYLKMVSTFVTWVNPNTPFYINGNECASKFIAVPGCILPWGTSCSTCQPDGSNCHSCCKCSSSYISGICYKPAPITSLFNILLNPLRILG